MVKNSPTHTRGARDVGLTLELGRSPGGGYGNPLQRSCLGNPTDRGTWLASLWGCKESDMTKHTHTVKAKGPAE